MYHVESLIGLNVPTHYTRFVTRPSTLALNVLRTTGKEIENLHSKSWNDFYNLCTHFSKNVKVIIKEDILSSSITNSETCFQLDNQHHDEFKNKTKTQLFHLRICCLLHKNIPLINYRSPQDFAASTHKTPLRDHKGNFFKHHS